MRTLTTQEEKVLAGGRSVTHARVRVKDSGGTFRNLSDFYGRDWLESWEVDEDVDQPVATLRLVLKREAYHDSLAPLRTDTRPNLVTGSYSPLVYPGHEVVLEVALMPEGIQPASGDWRELFRGDFDEVDSGGGALIEVNARDLGGRLQDLWHETEETYGNAWGVSLEKVIQQMVDRGHGPTFEAGTTYAAASGTTHGDRVTPTAHNGRWYRVTTGGTASAEPSWPTTIGNMVTSGGVTFTCAGEVPTLQVPESPGYNITNIIQPPSSVMECIRSLALGTVGWDVRYRWSTTLEAFTLTLVKPDRTISSPMYTFDEDHYFAVPSFVIDRTTVRNRVGVVYTDATDLDTSGQPKRKLVTAEDKDSMDLYSRGLPRWCQIAEGATSPIDSPPEATTLAGNALADLKDPVATAQYEAPLFYAAQLGDYYTFAGNDVHHTADQDLAVTGLRHVGSMTSCRTTLSVRGKPVAGVKSWLRMEAGDSAGASSVPPQAPTSLRATPVQGGLTVEYATPGDVWAETELHLSESAGFTPSQATFRARSRSNKLEVGDLVPGRTYYVKLIARDQAGNQSAASAEIAGVVAGATAPRHMEPQVVYDHLPLNPDFEAVLSHDLPPETWTVGAGSGLDDSAWPANMMLETTEVHGGTYSVKFVSSEAGATVRYLASQPFPIPANAFILVDGWAKAEAPGTGGAGLRLSIQASDSIDGPWSGIGGLSDVGTTSFQRYKATGAAGSSDKFARVAIGVQGNNFIGYWDSVSAVVSSEDWTELEPAAAFQVPPVDGLDFPTLSYFRDRSGYVHLRGRLQAISATSNPALISGLPSGCRPEHDMLVGGASFTTIPTDGTSPEVFQVDSSGQIVLLGSSVVDDHYVIDNCIFLGT